MSKPPTIRPSLSGHQSSVSSINGIADRAKPPNTSFTSASVLVSLGAHAIKCKKPVYFRSPEYRI